MHGSSGVLLNSSDSQELGRFLNPNPQFALKLARSGARLRLQPYQSVNGRTDQNWPSK